MGSGGSGDILHDCLEVDIKTNEDINSVEFHNFQYNQMPLPYKIPLSSEDTFHFLANICVSDVIYTIYREVNKLGKFDIKYLREHYKNQKNQSFTHFNRTHWRSEVEIFAIEYLDYLIVGLQNKTINPYDILRLSGPKIIDFLSRMDLLKEFIDQCLAKLKNVNELSRNEQLLFFTLLETLHPDTIRSFYKKNVELILALREKFYTPFRSSFISKEKITIDKTTDISITDQLEEIRDEPSINIITAIEQARKQKHKIILVKAHNLIAAMTDIGKILTSSKVLGEVPYLSIPSVVQRLQYNRGERDLKKYAMFEKIEFKPPLKPSEVYEVIQTVIDESEKGEVFDIRNGEKIETSGDHKVNPKWKDILNIQFFSEVLTKGILDENSIKTIIKALYETSKERVLVLPHPNLTIETVVPEIVKKVGLEPISVPYHLMKEFMKSAIIATEKPE